MKKDNSLRKLLAPLRLYVWEICIILPAFIYLFGFLIIISGQLVNLSLTYAGPSSDTYPTLQNFVNLAGNQDFNNALKNTIVFFFIGMPLELIFGLAMALLIYRQFRGRGIARSLFILPMAIPPIVTATMLYILSDYPAGHINSLLTGKYAFFPEILTNPVNWRSSPSVALGLSMFGKIWRDTPISMLFLLSGLTTITLEQYEAVETMGGNTFTKFRYITLPSLIPAISYVMLLRTVEMWKEFIFPFILAGQFPLLGTLIEEVYHNWHSPTEAAAISIILMLCIVISSALVYLLSHILKRSFFNVDN